MASRTAIRVWVVGVVGLIGAFSATCLARVTIAEIQDGSQPRYCNRTVTVEGRVDGVHTSAMFYTLRDDTAGIEVEYDPKKTGDPSDGESVRVTASVICQHSGTAVLVALSEIKREKR